MALALQAPERVDRLVLCCTAAFLGPIEGWHDRARIVRAKERPPSPRPCLDAGSPSDSATRARTRLCTTARCSRASPRRATRRAARRWRGGTLAPT
jgi:pimeloyl-ACP methyl ester carboxylesterase